MSARLVRWFPWLSTHHPLTAREIKRIPVRLPVLIQKLTDPWTTLGYAAMIHGGLFALSLLGFQRAWGTLGDLFLPFLTPFGTPISAAMLHSVLYWVMMIGVSNYTVSVFGRDLETHTWGVLRLIPFSMSQLVGAKLITVFWAWRRVLNMLFLTRLVAMLILPASILLQHRNNEVMRLPSLDLASVLVFLAQPFADAFLVASLSAAVALYINNTALAKAGAYGLVAVAYGALNGLGGLWLIFSSPLGASAGLLVPLAHWAPLVVAVVGPQSPTDQVLRTGLTFGIYLLAPILLGLISLLVVRRLGNQAI